MSTTKRWSISVFTEDTVGMLNRITIVFTRRHINIESITASMSEVPGIYRYTIVITASEDQIQKVVGQLDKLVEVVKAFYHPDEQVVYQELALFKIRMTPETNQKLEKLVRDHGARLLAVDPEYVVLELTGHERQINDLVKDLNGLDLLEFSRSGSVAVTKPMPTLTELMENN
ncbi:MAG: acetolactate synthase small subunit [Fluviicola sp.]|jgi:acetolactate synthase-1/3 small subunit